VVHAVLSCFIARFGDKTATFSPRQHLVYVSSLARSIGSVAIEQLLCGKSDWSFVSICADTIFNCRKGCVNVGRSALAVDSSSRLVAFGVLFTPVETVRDLKVLYAHRFAVFHIWVV